MSIVDNYNRLKTAHETARRKAERAEGALEQLLTQLKRDFDVVDLIEAGELLSKIKADGEKASRKAEKLMTRFVEKWKDKL